MASEKQSPAAATAEEPILDSNGNPVDWSEGFMSGGLARSKFRIINPPSDRKLQWISERDVKKGNFHGWALYTPADYARDRLNGMDIPARPDLSGGRVQVALHWLVWIPMEIWERNQAQIQERMRARDEDVRTFNVDDRHRKTVNVRGGLTSRRGDLPENPL